MRKILFAFILVVFAPLLISQQAMNNESVLKLCKAGLSDELLRSNGYLRSGICDYVRFLPILQFAARMARRLPDW